MICWRRNLSDMTITDDNLSISKNNNIWMPTIDLNEKDREIIESDSGWMNDKIINAAQKLLKPSINGLQNTLFISTFNDETGSWVINKDWNGQSAPSAQIHFNGNNHWLLTYQKVNNGPVYIVDSLKSKRTLNANMTIQISQLYNVDDNYINVIIPDVQRQNNSSDCGVFSIAFLIELLLTQFAVDISNIRFDHSLMRKHLLRCLNTETFSVFPKISKMPKMPVNEPKAQKIK